MWRGLSVRRASSYVEAGDQRVPRLQVYILLRALAVNALLNKSLVTATPPSAEPPSSKPLAPLVCTHSPQPYQQYHHHNHQHQHQHITDIISISCIIYNLIGHLATLKITLLPSASLSGKAKRYPLCTLTNKIKQNSLQQIFFKKIKKVVHLDIKSILPWRL